MTETEAEFKNKHPRSHLIWYRGYAHFSKIQPVVFYQCCVLIGWATTRLYVIAH